MAKNAVVNQSEEFVEFDEYSTLNQGFGFSIRADSRRFAGTCF